MMANLKELMNVIEEHAAAVDATRLARDEYLKAREAVRAADADLTQATRPATARTSDASQGKTSAQGCRCGQTANNR